MAKVDRKYNWKEIFGKKEMINEEIREMHKYSLYVPSSITSHSSSIPVSSLLVPQIRVLNIYRRNENNCNEGKGSIAAEEEFQ